MNTSSFQPASRQLLAAIALLGMTLYGCGDSTPSPSGSTVSTAGSTTSSAEYRLPVLRNAIHILGNLQRFDQQIALDQVVDRLNQWGHLQKVDVDWKVDPFMDSTLPKRYVDSPWLAHLKDGLFNHEMDGDFLRESTWLRDISNSAHGDKLDDLSTAEHLFDWTVRNIQLVALPAAKPGQKAVDVSPYILGRHSPSDILLQGYGTAEQRAWIFILLARQQQLDVVLLATPDSDHPDQPRPWLPALLHKDGDREQLYLFDSSLGLPIPGPGGKGIATLAQAIDDPTVLAHLDLDDSHHYPIKAAEAKQAIALVEASPGYLAKRMKMLEMQLAGTERMVLSSSPAETVARLKKVSHLSSEPRLWTWPYDVLNLRASDFQAPQQIKDILITEQAPFLLPAHHGDRHLIDPNAQQRALDNLMEEGLTKMADDEGKLPDNETKEQRAYRRAMKANRPMDTNFPLAAGRVLQFRHEYGGEYGAKHYYIECRPGEDQMQDYVQELVNDFREPNQTPPVQRYAIAILRRKQDATYWLGCLSFDEREYATAEEYFKNLVLDVWPKGCPWTDGAHYNLARTYEASGRIDEAVKIYEADDSAQRHGNRLRARWLKEKSVEAKSKGKSSAAIPSAQEKSSDAASPAAGASKDSN
jgi:tetratricopeptide (TPR) repeat protein